jgi:outer membrane PBP1 activator LpoA protein
LSASKPLCRIILLAFLASLTACTTAPTTSTVDSASVESRAQQARKNGDLLGAARLFRQLAAATRGSERSRYLIEAAGLLIEANDYAAAELALTEARSTAAVDQLAIIEIYAAGVDIGLGRASDALARISALGPVSDPALASALARTRGLALFALQRYVEAVTVFVEREIWLDSSAAVLENQRLIWDGIAGAGMISMTTGDELVDGWLALAPAAALESNPTEFRRNLIEWRGRFGTHPAAGGILAEIVSGQRGTLEFPRQIALLLPLGSNRRSEAQAVRDGFIAAHLGDLRAADTRISIYDTAIAGGADAYLRAQLDGADFIVGPLLPNEVEQIVPQAGFVPTLALNFSQADTTFPQSLYQYALAPQDEATAIAERSIADGRLTAIGLFRSDDRGYRLMASFQEAFETLGGEVLAATAYVPESQNMSGPIANLLNVSRSEQRHRRLQANLGTEVDFESRRRQDVDMIFLQATPRDGRLLAPQLRFHKAGDIPTYATSDIYDTAREGRDSDLNGIVFTDLPVLLSPDSDAERFVEQLGEFWPQRTRQWIRFYSFGFDAYQLIGPIFNPAFAIWPRRGMTGELSIESDGRIHRALPFARFENGTPNALGPPAVRPGNIAPASDNSRFEVRGGLFNSPVGAR